MKDTISGWEKKIDEITQSFKELYQVTNIGHLDKNPNQTSWSISNIVEHLIIVNNSFFDEIENRQKESYKIPWIGSIGFVQKLWFSLLLPMVRPGTDKKSKTTHAWMPKGSIKGKDGINQLIDSQEKIKEAVRSAKSLLDRGAVIKSPIARYIVYPLEDAINVIVIHQEKHLEQALSLKKSFLNGLSN